MAGSSDRLGSCGPRALILTYGSRGDVEPFLALALGLRDAGCHVGFSTSERFGAWIESHGFAFFPLPDESLALIETPDGKAMIEGAGGLLHRLTAGIRLARRSTPLNDALMRAVWGVAEPFRPDLILFHSKLMAAPHVAEKLGAPALLGLLQPMLMRTSAFPSTGMTPLRPAFLNRLSYWMTGLAFGAFKGAVNRFRRDTLGLGRIRRRSEVLAPRAIRPVPALHAISPAVLPRPEDWPAHASMTGYWRLPPDPTFSPPPELAAFLEVGPPPVFIGFGSMVSEDPEGLGRVVVEALKRAGVRGVVAGGWAGLTVESGGDIIAIPPVPYGWLFPRMAAVVHHGGAGTTAEGFHAGVPSVICPFFGDQPGWAARAAALGVATAPIPRRRLTADALAAAIRQAVSDPSLKENASALAARLQDENGVAQAVEIISHAMGRGQNR